MGLLKQTLSGPVRETVDWWQVALVRLYGKGERMELWK